MEVRLDGDGDVLDLDAFRLTFSDNSMRRASVDAMYCSRDAVKRTSYVC